jgi:hypothetical protein
MIYQNYLDYTVMLQLILDKISIILFNKNYKKQCNINVLKINIINIHHYHFKIY